MLFEDVLGRSKFHAAACDRCQVRMCRHNERREENGDMQSLEERQKLSRKSINASHVGYSTSLLYEDASNNEFQINRAAIVVTF